MKAQRLEPTSKKQRKITEFLKNWARLSKQVCYTQVWVPQNRVGSQQMDHPGWQGLGDKCPCYLQSRCLPFKFVRENGNLTKVIGNRLGDISEMILYESFIAHGIWVSGVLTQCLTQNDEAPGVFHLGLDMFEVGILGDLVTIRCPKLCFLELKAKACVTDCPGKV